MSASPPTLDPATATVRDLHARIDAAIARVKASRAADEVLNEIAKTHVLVPRPLAERAAEAFDSIAQIGAVDEGHRHQCASDCNEITRAITGEHA